MGAEFFVKSVEKMMMSVETFAVGAEKNADACGKKPLFLMQGDCRFILTNCLFFLPSSH